MLLPRATRIPAKNQGYTKTIQHLSSLHQFRTVLTMKWKRHLPQASKKYGPQITLTPSECNG